MADGSHAADDEAAHGAKRQRLPMSAPQPVRGRVFVARFEPGKPKPATPPGVERCVNVWIHTDTRVLGGALSPYHLRDERGCLLENAWQFAKLYPRVAAQRTPVSRFRPEDIVWEHPAETHVAADTQTVLPAYWAWRERGMHAPRAVRYPVGFQARHTCLGALWPADRGEPVRAVHNGVSYTLLDYATARRRIYCAIYARCASAHTEFTRLADMLAAGQSLQLLDVDAPRVEWYRDALPRAREAGDAGQTGICMDEATLRHLVRDTAHPFGHGCVLAALLLGGAEWIT